MIQLCVVIFRLNLLIINKKNDSIIKDIIINQKI